MKKLFTLALSIVISSSIFAAAEFFIKINSNGSYTVSLNNQTLTSPNNIYKFYDLTPGIYTLKVRENGIFGRLLYNQTINIQNNFRTVAEMNQNFNLNIIDKLALNPQNNSWYYENLPGNPNFQGCNGHGHPKHCNHPQHPGKPNGPKGPKDCKHCMNNYNWYNNNGYGQNFPGGLPYPNNFPMNNNTGPFANFNLLDDNGLQSIIQAMRNTNFDNNKLDIAKAALKNRNLKTNQVSQLLQQFTFEQYKLDLAKFCYDKTTDPFNYFSLSNDFTFDSYASELTAYINSR